MDSHGFRLFWTWKDLLPKSPYVFSPLRLRAFSDSLNVVTSLVLSLLHSLRFLVRSRASLHLEVIALRHQLAVLNRSRPRPRRTSADRMFWAWLSHAWRGWRSAIQIVRKPWSCGTGVAFVCSGRGRVASAPDVRACPQTSAP